MPMMPAGTHMVKVMSTMLGQTRKGDPQILVRFENTDGEHITWYGYFTPKALPYTLERLKTCGWDAATHNNDVASLHGSSLLVGQEVEIVVEDEEGQDGKVRPRVSWINQPRISPDEAKAIGERLRDQIARESGADAGPNLDDTPF